MRLRSPYRNDGTPWLRGNLHAHTTESDGARAPQAVVDAYAALGYDFLAITDHDTVTGVDALDARGMVLLPGNEVTAYGPHVLHVGAGRRVAPDLDRQRVLDGIAGGGGLAIFNHPNRDRLFDHCPQSALESLRGFAGIEVYNGVTRRQEGSPLATGRWDRLLGIGVRVWGFANDDSHRAEDDGVAWNMVQAAPTREAVIEALRAGRFYGSTGVRIRSIAVAGRTACIETENAERIAAIGGWGRRMAAADAPRLEYTLPPDAETRHLRFECYGPGESMAWSQPLWVEGPLA